MCAFMVINQKYKELQKKAEHREALRDLRLDSERLFTDKKAKWTSNSYETKSSYEPFETT